MHIVTRLGNLRSSRGTRLLFSAGTLRFLGAACFLNGSTPDALAQGWHRYPGSGSAATVYLVYEANMNGFEREDERIDAAYDSELFIALCAVVKAPNGLGVL